MKSHWLVALLGSVLMPSSALAAPHVYTDLVTGLPNLNRCIEMARKTANTNGFTDNQEVVNQGEGSRDFFANHNAKSASMTISCSSKLKGAAVSVAGDDNDEAFELFRMVYRDF